MLCQEVRKSEGQVRKYSDLSRHVRPISFGKRFNSTYGASHTYNTAVRKAQLVCSDLDFISVAIKLDATRFVNWASNPSQLNNM